MNKLAKNILVIITVVALAYFGNKGVQSYLGTQAVNDIAFTVYSLDEAKRKAQKEGKLVLADYSAIWCPSCRKLDTEVFASEKIAQTIENTFFYARIEYDSDEGKMFASQYDLVGFPRVLVLKPNGDKLVEMPLTFDPVEYNLNLERVIATVAP